MDCPNCDDGYLESVDVADVEFEGSGRIVITWNSECRHCGYKTQVEEEFESTGWEKEKEEE